MMKEKTSIGMSTYSLSMKPFYPESALPPICGHRTIVTPSIQREAEALMEKICLALEVTEVHVNEAIRTIPGFREKICLMFERDPDTFKQIVRDPETLEIIKPEKKGN